MKIFRFLFSKVVLS